MDTGTKNEIINHILARARQIERLITGLEIVVNFEGFEDVSGREILEEPVFYQYGPRKGVEDELKVVSWNIATGDKFDDVFKYLREINADIIFLQEVGVNCPPNYKDVFLDLTEGLGCSGVFGRSMAFVTPERKPLNGTQNPAVIGEAILSKCPIRNRRLLALPPYFDWTKFYAEPKNLIDSSRVGNRVAILSTIGDEKNELTGCSLHLEDKCFGFSRACQLKYVLDKIDGNFIVGGDFNTFFGPVEPIYLEVLKRNLEIANSIRSTIKGLPFPLDNIVSNSYRFEEVYIDKTQKCSDHYPLLATLTRKN